jgi:hypothetical protein
LRPPDPHLVVAGGWEKVPVTPAPLADAPSDWVLALGEAARLAGLRSDMHAARGNHLRAWRSRRAAARARRRAVQELLAGKASAKAAEGVAGGQLTPDIEAPAPVWLAPTPTGLEHGARDGEKEKEPRLPERIAAYTLSPR